MPEKDAEPPIRPLRAFKLLRSEEDVAWLKAEGASSKESLAATIAEMQEQLKTALGQRKQLEADIGSAKQSTAGLPKLVKELEQTKVCSAAQRCRSPYTRVLCPIPSTRSEALNRFYVTSGLRVNIATCKRVRSRVTAV